MKIKLLFLLLLALQSALAEPAITLTCTADGTKPFAFQWYLGATKIAAPQGQQATLTLKPPYLAGLYKCVVSNSAGSTETPAIRIATTAQVDAASVAITIKK